MNPDEKPEPLLTPKAAELFADDLDRLAKAIGRKTTTPEEGGQGSHTHWICAATILAAIARNRMAYELAHEWTCQTAIGMPVGLPADAGQLMTDEQAAAAMEQFERVRQKKDRDSWPKPGD